MSQTGIRRTGSISSSTFANDSTIPVSMINNFAVNGGNLLPELPWGRVPHGTTSLVVVAFEWERRALNRNGPSMFLQKIWQ
jgi:phosphatidylethanolamine-binding protein (PEBP) family uncharacterized protein